MSQGFNSEVSADGVVYHVQTERRTAPNATLDTVVYVSGRVIHRVNTNCQDLLDRGASLEELRQRVERQHREVVRQIESGQVRNTAPVAAELNLRLANGNSWLRSGNAAIELEVSTKDGKPVDGAKIEALVESPNGVAASKSGKTGADGRALLEFALPSPMPEGAALVVRASLGSGRAELRYKLKSRRDSSS